MKKLGFTLAEILITLGIVGVVAALTTPALVMSSKNEANGAKLAVVVNALENAFTTAIATEGAQNLYHTQMWLRPGAIGNTSNIQNKKIFVGELGKYLIFNGSRVNNSTEVWNYYGTEGENQDRKLNIYQMSSNGGTGDKIASGAIISGCVPIEMKNGAVVFIRTFANEGDMLSEDTAIARGTAYRGNAADVYIDVNAGAGPNTLGRDIFIFEVGQNGILYPTGGYDIRARENHVDENGVVSDWRDEDSDVACKPEKGKVGNGGGSGGSGGCGCTARLVAEGYKMNY